jgi:hypothetical protein
MAHTFSTEQHCSVEKQTFSTQPRNLWALTHFTVHFLTWTFQVLRHATRSDSFAGATTNYLLLNACVTTAPKETAVSMTYQ